MTAWRWSALGGVLTVLIGLSFALVPDIGACDATNPGGVWADFQRIRSVADVATRIRPDCANALVPALKSSMWLDALAFIPVYALLLGAALVALRAVFRPVFAAGVVLLGAGVVADQSEGVLLLNILNALPGNQALIDVLIPVKLAKELALSGATIAVGILLVLRGHVARWPGLLIAKAAAIGVIAELFFQVRGALGLLIGWLTLTGVACAMAWKAKVV